MPVLRWKSGDKVEEVALTKDNFRMGRTSENDLEIPSNLVSRRQSSIVKKGDKYLLYDLDSSNGTFVNGERVEMKVLADGDIIRLGDIEVTFADDVKETKPMPSPPGPKAKAFNPLTDAGSSLIKNVDDIAESYAFDISEALSQGRSLTDIQKTVGGGEGGGKETKMFFILFQVGKELSSASSLEEMLRVSMKLIFEVINAQRGVMLRLDEETKGLKPEISFDRRKGFTDEEIGVSTTITNRVLKERVATITSDALQDPRFSQGMSIVQFNIRSALCVPIWEGERSYGVIYLDNVAKSYAFTADDLELLTAIANLVGIRIKQDELREKLQQEQMLRNNLSKYHSPDVVEYLVSKGGEIGLEVAEREVTVLFVDVESSTKLAENMEPAKVAALLNEFFEMATEAVFQYNGHVNKFIGDAVMAIFNAPLDLSDHAVAGVKAALQIVQSLRRHNQEHPDRKFNIRVGVNTGLAVAGNVGTANRMEYTVLGDSVNVAARLVAFPNVNSVIIGENTYEKAKEVFKAKDLGEVVLKGKEKSLRAYEVDIPE